MIDTMGVILTAGNGDFSELTRVRSVSALPFAGRYRLIDFALSNMVNSGIVNVGVATDYNYQSLLDHLGSGKPWSLARKKFGLRFLPPFQVNQTDAEEQLKMLFNVIHFLKRSPQQYVVVADGNNVCNVTFDKVVEQHKRTGAELTIVYCQKPFVCGSKYVVVQPEGQVDGIIAPKQHDGKLNKPVGYYVFTKEYLVTVLERCQMLGKKSFFYDVIAPFVERGSAFGYCYDGYLAEIDGINAYFNASMDLFDGNVRKSLFMGENSILTKVKDKVPTRYLSNAVVSNSLVADGCVIDGEVTNCILFRGVTVQSGAKLSNCIVMQNSVISQNVRLGCCIIDKDCLVRKDKELVGQAEFPIIVGKHRTI